jgi:hypothetical protein
MHTRERVVFALPVIARLISTSVLISAHTPGETLHPSRGHGLPPRDTGEAGKGFSTASC